MPPPDSGELLELAIDCVLAGGELVAAGRERAASDPVGTKSSPTDVVTAMDRAGERLVADRLRVARPDDAVLGEERGELSGRSRVRWVLDPIDGTVNYLYGLPAYAVSLAAEVAGEAVAAAVFNPATGELWTARAGGGAWLGRPGAGRRLPGPAERPLGQALVGTGFSYSAARRASQAAVVAALLPQIRDIRRFGAASLDLCAVAAGRLDAYFERGLQPWDHAAGALVATEAGARVGGLRGAAAGERLVLAAAPGLFDRLHDQLLMLHADEGP